MSFLPCNLHLLAVDTGNAAAPASTVKTWAVSCPVNDPRGAKMAVVVSLAQSGGATSPNATVVLEMSPDGVRWFLTESTASTSTEDTSASHFASDTVALRYLRATVTAAGGTRPAVVCDVFLLSEITLVATLVE